MDKISVIGSGSWGTTLANHLAEKGFKVKLWSYEKDLVDEIKRTGINSTYLPGIPLSRNIDVTDDLSYAIKDARYILSVVPTQFTRSVFSNVTNFLSDDAMIVSASKGIEHGSLLTVSSILGNLTGRKVSVLSGPSFAEEVIKKLPTAVTIASPDNEVAMLLQDLFNTENFCLILKTSEFIQILMCLELN